jgi:hypothetical protein
LARAIATHFVNSARALADALGVKQEIEKTLAQNGRLAK